MIVCGRDGAKRRLPSDEKLAFAYKKSNFSNLVSSSLYIRPHAIDLLHDSNMYLFILAFATGFIPHAFANPTANWIIGQEVTTSSGKIIGSAATRLGFQEVSQYVGIPYAIPPTGSLRWTAPQAFKGTGSIDGTKWKDDCSQPTGAATLMKSNKNLEEYSQGMGGMNHTYSEDCLGLNVWTAPQKGEKSKAVLLWVHGGAFSSGNANAPFMDGARFAKDEDVVLVSIHYRKYCMFTVILYRFLTKPGLNIFGFPNAPGLPAQNLGMLDIRLATEWVRDNIAAFGGDPKRITIFGESAGGAAVDMYAYAWPQDPIIAGVIAQSGGAGVAPPSGQDPAEVWYQISKLLDCGGKEAGAKTVECMKKVPTATLLVQLDKMSSGPGSTPFGPSADGKTVFRDYAARGTAGSFIKVPVLAGNTDHESGLNTAIGMSLGGGKAGSGKDAGGGKGGVMGALPAALTSMLPKDFNPENIMDYLMTCSSARTVGVRRKNNIPAWRYRYMGVWDNTSLGPKSGAYHSGEIPVVFGTTELRKDSRPDTPEEAKVVKDTMHAWASFAKDPQKGLLALGWPVYDESKETLIRIGHENKSAFNLVKATEYDGVCAMMNRMMGA